MEVCYFLAIRHMAGIVNNKLTICLSKMWTIWSVRLRSQNLTIISKGDASYALNFGKCLQHLVVAI